MFDDLREQSITATDYEYDDKPEAALVSRLTDFVNSFSPKQRFFIALMLFLNVTFLGCLCLVVTGRIAM